MRVHWLVQSMMDLPEDDDWLSADELSRLRSMKVAKRRDDWRLGRWIAKQTIAAAWPDHFDGQEPPRGSSCEIRAASDGAPEAHLLGEKAPMTISISHSMGLGVCVAAAGRVVLGCDIEQIARRSDRFVEDYFTLRECAFTKGVAADERALAATLIWSAKESALKALREGLRLDTRSVEVSVTGGLVGVRWAPLTVHQGAREPFRGLWRTHDGFVLTIVSETEPEMIRCRRERGPPL